MTLRTLSSTGASLWFRPVEQKFNLLSLQALPSSAGRFYIARMLYCSIIIDWTITSELISKALLTGDAIMRTECYQPTAILDDVEQVYPPQSSKVLEVICWDQSYLQGLPTTSPRATVASHTSKMLPLEDLNVSNSSKLYYQSIIINRYFFLIKY